MMGTNNPKSSFLLLPTYVGFETARAIITYSAAHAGVAISPTFITLWYVVPPCPDPNINLLTNTKHRIV